MNVINKILAIETSCDDTSVAIVNNDGFVESLASANQDLAHEPFGGVVPEIASRNHTLNLLPLIEKAFEKSNNSWDSIDGIAVTSRPGLVGSLLVGLVSAKSLSFSKNKPLICVNHIEGHILACFLKDHNYQPSCELKFPFLALVISGGHTHLFKVKELGQIEILGHTVDDAAGEAFDKFGKLLGLGFPGGVMVDKNSKGGDPTKFSFPRAMLNEKNLMFSFSGLKTAAHNLLLKMDKNKIDDELNNLCASFQDAIVDVIIKKLHIAVQETGITYITISGGVSANSRLREVSQSWAQKNGIQLNIPPLKYCTDNGAMIGYAGIKRLLNGERSVFSEGPSAKSLKDDFKLNLLKF